jgi:nitrite reductase/ring-hydroxylating ferredoxin subunit
MSQMNRRDFVAAVACAACLCGLGTATDLFADATDAPTTAPSTTLDVGPKSAYAKDGITATWMRMPNRVAVIRHEGKIYACTSVCTHRQGTLNKVPGIAPAEDSFVCPRHGATFDIDGHVTKRPARQPLLRFAISTGDNGHLIVDKTQTFAEDQWDNPASFVKV